MKRKYVVALSAIALLVGGAVVASNMGFKLNKTLNGLNQAGSLEGTQDVGLPFNPQTSLVSASNLRTDILASGSTIVSIGKYNPVSDAFDTYSGGSILSDFALVPAEGYRVRVTTGSPYIIVGSHDPGLVVTLDAVGTNGSTEGNQLISYPYHSTANTASALRAEIIAQGGGSVVVSVGRYNPLLDAPLTYSGGSVLSDFNLTPGEAYLIRVNADVAWVPSHY